ncbi:hypothetical protein KIL84_012445 [Mauremys mutica]|uniref:Phosphoinositide phospholipase C n=1 Tax=Mauremys mutica TaxID=74926 RepID=A0A9D3XPN5_9SAUR|nr:hypothetical protein KIL84_012445 [Mauremys mutica]
MSALPCRDYPPLAGAAQAPAMPGRGVTVLLEQLHCAWGCRAAGGAVRGKQGESRGLRPFLSCVERQMVAPASTNSLILHPAAVPWTPGSAGLAPSTSGRPEFRNPSGLVRGGDRRSHSRLRTDRTGHLAGRETEALTGLDELGSRLPLRGAAHGLGWGYCSRARGRRRLLAEQDVGELGSPQLCLDPLQPPVGPLAVPPCILLSGEPEGALRPRHEAGGAGTGPSAGAKRQADGRGRLVVGLLVAPRQQGIPQLWALPQRPRLLLLPPPSRSRSQSWAGPGAHFSSQLSGWVSSCPERRGPGRAGPRGAAAAGGTSRRCPSGQAPDDSPMALHLYSPRLQLDETLQQMQQGTLMRKVKSKSWKKQRYFKLQDDCMTVWYKSKKTGNTKYTFSISDVETVREGHQSEVLQSLAEEFPPEHCFTVVFHGRRGNLDLIAGSPEEAQCWVRGLRRLVEIVTKMDQQEKMDQYPSAGLAPSPGSSCPLAPRPVAFLSPPGRWICDWFHKADKNKDGRMSFKEVRQLLRMMNMDMNEDHAVRLFQMADRSESGTLEGEEFVLFYKALTQRDDVLGVFQAFSQDGKKLTLLELVDFLQQEQLEGENTQEFAMELIARYEPSESARARHVLSLNGFLLYLRSPEGAIFNPVHGPLCQDMTQPLCHYFISSSHNTYLLEDQLRGQSSVEGYIRALKRGCRCLEVDCWDGPSGEPVVYHGHTFTSKIPFQDVVRTLGQYGFQASDYPVILSLENHCGPEQQHLMAQHLTGILGERLLTAPLDARGPPQLPSPEELRGRIILKGKRAESLAHSPSGQPDEAPEREASEDDDGLEAEEESLSQEAKGKAEVQSREQRTRAGGSVNGWLRPVGAGSQPVATSPRDSSVQGADTLPHPTLGLPGAHHPWVLGETAWLRAAITSHGARALALSIGLSFCQELSRPPADPELGCPGALPRTAGRAGARMLCALDETSTLCPPTTSEN